MRFVASLAVLAILGACATSSALKDQRVEYWQQKLAQDLRVGMPRTEVETWAASNHLKFTLHYSKSEPALVTYAEDIPGSFSVLTGCKGWHIWIGIFFGESDLMTRSDVRGEAICL